MALFLAAVFTICAFLGILAYYKARTILIFPHHSMTYRSPGPAPRARHDAQLHTPNPTISLLNTPAYSFATTAVSRTPQKSFNIDRHRTPLSAGWSAKSCATAFSIKSVGPVSLAVSTYNEDPENLDVEVSEMDAMTTRTALSIPRSPIGAAY